MGIMSAIENSALRSEEYFFKKKFLENKGNEATNPTLKLFRI